MKEYVEGVNMLLEMVVEDRFEMRMRGGGGKGESMLWVCSGEGSGVKVGVRLGVGDVGKVKGCVECKVLVVEEMVEKMREGGVEECVEMLKDKLGGKKVFVIREGEEELEE